MSSFRGYCRPKVKHRCAIEALARAAEGGPLTRTEANLDVLAHSTKTLVALYLTACEDQRTDERAIAVHLEDLYWWVIGAAVRYLDRDNPDCWIEWGWWISYVRRLAMVLVDIIGSACAAVDVLEDKVVNFEALAFSAAALHDWFQRIKATLEPSAAEEFLIDRDADRLAKSLFGTVNELKARFGIEPRAAR